jgi:CMP/dCMP kinase
MSSNLIAITIARQLGAGAAPLGKRLSQRLVFTYLDDEILRRAAEKAGADPEDLARWDEHRSRFWDRLAQTFSLGAPEGMYTPATGAIVVHDREVFELQSQVIRETAARENCIVIGRAGFWILRDHPGRISVYLHAPPEARVPEVMAAFKVDESRARELIAQIDADRARFLRETTGCDLTAPTQHLCIDTSAIPLDVAEEMVVKVVEAKQRRG